MPKLDRTAIPLCRVHSLSLMVQIYSRYEEHFTFAVLLSQGSILEDHSIPDLPNPLDLYFDHIAIL